MDHCLTPILIEQLLAESLPSPERQRAETHLSECESCRREIRDRGVENRIFSDLKLVYQAESQLDSDGVGRTMAMPRLAKHLQVGQGVGPYVIRKHLGEGAFGDVYMAEQTEPFHRLAALKIIKPGMDTEQVIARFGAERKALAIMNHPCIAKVLDAGTTDEGRPYFVMEYVPGELITTHCDRHRLNIESRLQLFIQVCDAMQHAHQKGIIHRDLKPSNILVSVDGDKVIPKVIDFGVAKAVNQPLIDKTFHTQRGQIIGTLEYMAPEQADLTEQDIDTRSDIYSLGVLLYELLTGRLPIDVRRGAYDEIVRTIREVEPPRPSTKLSTLMTSGSSNIVNMVHGRDSDARTLVRRIRGDLDWITMKCLEKKRIYRYASASELARDIRKHLRNQPLDFPLDLTHRARKFLRRHRMHLVQAAGVTVLVFLLAFAVLSKLEAIEARKGQARTIRAEAKLLALSDPSASLAMLDELIEIDPEFVSAKIERAFLLHLEQKNDAAIEAAKAIVAEHPEVSGGAHFLLAQLSPDLERREYHLSEARRLLPDDRLYRALALSQEQPEEAIRLLTESLEEVQRWDFEALSWRALLYAKTKQFEKSITDASELVKVRRDLAGTWELKGATLLRSISETLRKMRVGRELAPEEQERLEEAIRCFDKAVELDADRWINYHNRAHAWYYLKDYSKTVLDSDLSISRKSNYANTHTLKAWALLRLRRYDDALSSCERALELDSSESAAYECQGLVLKRLRKADGAITAFSKAIELAPEYGKVYIDRGHIHHLLGRFEEAVRDYTSALERMPGAAVVHNLRGASYLELRRLEEAEADFKKTIQLGPNIHTAYYNLGRVYLIQGKYDSALIEYEKAIQRRQGDLELYRMRGIAYWFSGDETNALIDFIHVLKASPVDYFPAFLWIWEIRSLDGKKAAAEAALDKAYQTSESEWQRRLVTLLRGETTDEALLVAAEGDGQHCEAFYYLGAQALVAGHRDKALALFQRCLNTGAVSYYEYDLAEWRVRTLSMQSP